MTDAPTTPCRLPRILGTAEGLIPSVELAANVPFARLQEQGLCEYRFRLVKEATLADLRWCDVLFVVRGASRRTRLFVDEAARYRRFVVSYWDDNPFCIPEYSSSHAHFTRPTIRAMVLGILSRSDTVASPTEALAEALANETGRPVVTLAVPSFGMVETIPQRPGGDRQVVIGFAGSTDHLTTVQDLVIPALEMVAQRGIEFRFEIVGPEPAVPPVLQGRMRHIPFFACYADWIAFRNSAPWDIALAPLPAGKFQACKYHNKFVEMGAAGLPCIFSNVPTYAGVVRHMHNGVLAENTPQAWADAITLLARTPAVRRRLAACAWEQVRRENAPEAVCRSYCATLQGAFRHRAPALTGLAGLMVTLRVRGLVLWLRLALAEGPGKVARRLRRAIGSVRRRLAPR